MRAMREQSQATAAVNKTLQASLHKAEGQALHWQNLWRSAAASNAQLTQRVTQLQDALGSDGDGGAAPAGLPPISVLPAASPLLQYPIKHRSAHLRPNAWRWLAHCMASGI